MSFDVHLNAFLKKELSGNKIKISNTPDFFKSAVKTARLSSKDIRQTIMSDMAEALSCDAEDLMFLFEAMSLNDNDTQTAVPSFRDAYLLEAAE